MFSLTIKLWLTLRQNFSKISLTSLPATSWNSIVFVKFPLVPSPTYSYDFHFDCFASVSKKKRKKKLNKSNCRVESSYLWTAIVKSQPPERITSWAWACVKFSVQTSFIRTRTSPTRKPTFSATLPSVTCGRKYRTVTKLLVYFSNIIQ